MENAQNIQNNKVLKASLTNSDGQTYFKSIVNAVRHYFTFAYHGGTREMLKRHINRELAMDVPEKVLSMALSDLKKSGAILFEKKVWWWQGDR